MNYLKFNELKEKNKHYSGQRICAQIEFAKSLADTDKTIDGAKISAAVDALYKEYAKDGTITAAAVKNCENALSFLTEKAKKYEVILAAHAHIDMNWMWGYNETVSITLSTFRTMLDLMNEYPDFTFSQSQASVYEIVEKYDKEMLEEIKKRVAEGRWEVTASTWVEADKNMTGGESLARHYLYTKRYLSGLLGIKPESLNIDFEPDTFGHNQDVPEAAAAAGIKYYYHCRGNNEQALYRWKGNAGNSVLVYREPHWYNWSIDYGDFAHVPGFCAGYGLTKKLKVYGVGDHGGGATRRDLDRISDMRTWPVMPALKFGAFKEFYEHVESQKPKLKTVTGEQNFIFTGCYTSQSRIKAANRKCERVMAEAELFSILAKTAVNAPYSGALCEKGWRNTLFNHFHDILPGSGVTETREYASALAQETAAIAGGVKIKALQKICAGIDTSKLLKTEENGCCSMSAGAGGGFEAAKGMFTAAAGAGDKRLFAVFNNLNEEREEIAEFTLWDYNFDIFSPDGIGVSLTDPQAESERLKKIVVKDCFGNIVRHELIDAAPQHYWGHIYVRLRACVKVPAHGYALYLVSADNNRGNSERQDFNPRKDEIQKFILENGFARAEFNSLTGALKSFYDKKSKKELVCGGVFRFVKEATNGGMSSWVVGRYAEIQNIALIKGAYISPGALKQAFGYTADFGEHGSNMTVEVSLKSDSATLEYNVKCDFREAGAAAKFVPQLQFYAPLSFKTDEYLYDTAFGVVRRQSAEDDRPGLSFICAKESESAGAGCADGIMLCANGKYGYRGFENSLTVDLIRGSYDPDPTPEYGMHSMSFALTPAGCGSDTGLINLSQRLQNPLSVINIRPSAGKLPPTASFLQVSGGAVVSAVKKHEDKDEVIIRLYEADGKEKQITITVGFVGRADRGAPAAAYLTDINEKLNLGTLTVENKSVKLTLKPYQLATAVLKI